VSAMYKCCEIQKLQLVDCSYPRIQATVVEQSETTMVSSSDVQLYPEERLGLGVQQETPDRYSYSRAHSHKSCIDQGDRWVIKFKLGLNLLDLIKL